MNVSVLALILVLTCNLVYGQKSSDFGDVSIKELSNETYSGDTASAVILFDVGSLVLEPNSVAGSTLKRHLRVKILKPQAFNQWGNQEFFVSKEGNLKVKGATYNLEGGAIRTSDLEESSIMRRSHNKEFERVAIAFPNVREGSIVELSYVSKHVDYYIPKWKFQHSIPSRKSEYTVTVPIKNIKYNLRGFLTPAIHEEKYEGTYHHWIMNDIPAFISEPMMADQDAYVSEVGFSLTKGDWEDIFYRLLSSQSFGEIVHRYKSLTSIAEEVTAGMTDERQKIRAISDYVKAHVEFNGYDDYSGINPNELIDKKKGSAGDINLFLGSLMEKAGLKVNMVLISTRAYGTIDQKIPSLRQFNYVICEVATKDGDILVDATDKLLTFDMLPPRCYNHLGFLVGTAQYGWIPIESKYRNKILLDATVTFTETGGLIGKLKAFKDGYAGYEVRNQYRRGNGKDYKLDLGNKLWNIEKYEIKNVETVGKPIEETCDVSIDEYVIMSNDKIYFNPHLFLREEANPFVSASRLYPVDFENLIDKTVVCTLVIPEGHAVEELPENKAIVLPGNAAKCTFSTTVDGNKIMVMSKLIFNRSLFLPSEYAGLKEFYGKLVAKKAENIVLKKK